MENNDSNSQIERMKEIEQMSAQLVRNIYAKMAEEEIDKIAGRTEQTNKMCAIFEAQIREMIIEDGEMVTKLVNERNEWIQKYETEVKISNRMYSYISGLLIPALERNIVDDETRFEKFKIKIEKIENLHFLACRKHLEGLENEFGPHSKEVSKHLKMLENKHTSIMASYKKSLCVTDEPDEVEIWKDCIDSLIFRLKMNKLPMPRMENLISSVESVPTNEPSLPKVSDSSMIVESKNEKKIKPRQIKSNAKIKKEPKLTTTIVPVNDIVSTTSLNDSQISLANLSSGSRYKRKALTEINQTNTNTLKSCFKKSQLNEVNASQVVKVNSQAEVDKAAAKSVAFALSQSIPIDKESKNTSEQYIFKSTNENDNKNKVTDTVAAGDDEDKENSQEAHFFEFGNASFDISQNGSFNFCNYSGDDAMINTQGDNATFNFENFDQAEEVDDNGSIRFDF